MIQKKPVSLKDVALRANVSTTTVSHVINKTRFVHPDTVATVKKAIDDLGYQTNYIARTLRRRKSNCIGIVLPDISHDFFFTFLKGVESVLYNEHYNIILSNSKEDLQIEQSQLSIFYSMQVDGIIIAPTSQSLPLGKSGKTKPIVCFDRIPQDLAGKVDAVVSDNREISQKVVAHLASKGHKAIAFATARQDLYPNREKMEGFRQAMRQHGFACGEESLRFVSPSTEAGERLMERLISENKVTALFINNLHGSVGALQYAIEHGIKIPGQMALVGSDNSIWARASFPQLTCIDVKASEMGVAAAKLLLERIKNPDKKIETVTVSADFIVRKTT